MHGALLGMTVEAVTEVRFHLSTPASRTTYLAFHHLKVVHIKYTHAGQERDREKRNGSTTGHAEQTPAVVL